MTRRHPILASIFFIFLVIFFVVLVFFLITSFKTGEIPAIFSSGEVAVVTLEGPIFDSTDILKTLHRYQKIDSIKAIVMRIDSPGGAVAPSQEIFEELKKIRQTKKVVASMGTVAASGGYYIALASHKIFASPGTITGSIGVIMESLNVAELLKWAHLENRVIKSGKYKDVGSPFRSMTPEDRAYLQAILDNMYQQFTQAVSEERKIPLNKMDDIANGKIYTGQKALEAGLIDQLGTVYDAIAEAKQMAGLPEDARVVWPKDYPDTLEWLLGSKDQSNSLEGFLKRNLQGVDSPVWLYLMNMKAVQ